MEDRVQYNREKLKHLSIADLFAVRIYANELKMQWERNPTGMSDDLMKNYWCPILVYASEEIRTRVFEAFSK